MTEDPVNELQQDENPVEYKDLNIWQRIHGVRTEVRAVAKDKEVGEGKYAYNVATHEGVNHMLRPLLNRWGLIDYVSLETAEIVDTGVQYGQRNPRTLMQYRGRFAYTVQSIDKDESVAIHVEGHGDDAGDKGPGKATTYAIKTGRSKMFSITTGEDEEGRVDAGQYVDPSKAPMSPEQLDQLLTLADELFGDDSESVLKRMCDKIFAVTAVKDIPAVNFEQCLGLLRNQHARDKGGDQQESL